MSNCLYKKALVFGIIALFVGSGLTSIISGAQLKEDKRILSTYDSSVYLPIPDWISENPHYSTGAALADFNRDGWLDLVVADGNDMAQGQLNVYYNDGNGALPTTASWQSDDFGYNGHLDVADVNGDGWPDVAVSYLGTSSTLGPIARVYLNNDGVLSSLPDWTSAITGNSFGVDFGDMNNDGRPDLAVATGWSYTPTSYHNYVYLNIDGTLESSASWESDDSDVVQGCLWVDADNDSWLDLVFIGTGDETKIYRNLGGMLETTASWQTSDSSNQDGIMLTTGDVNLDGITDLFATDNTQLGGSGYFKQYNGLPEGFFETSYSWSYSEGYGSAVALVDVNYDKKLDLATGGWWDFTRIFINEGSGLPTSPTWNSGGNSVVEKIVFGNIGPTYYERTFTENFEPDGDRKLFHLPHQQIQGIRSVYHDGVLLPPSKYTYSREHGWITVDTTPLQSIEVAYNYSRSVDMVVSNWDSGIGNYLYYNQLFNEDLNCDGDLSWIDVEYGETLEGSFTVENIGDSLSSLDWEIESYPDWGSWSFDPENGVDLTPEEGPVVVNVEVIAPLEGGIEFQGEIKVINQYAPEDYDIIFVSLSITSPQLEIGAIKGGLFNIKAPIKNTGSLEANDINWRITLDSGVFIGKETTDTITNLAIDSEETITSKLILGLGATTVTVTVESAEGVSDTREQTGFVLLFFIKVNPGG